MGNAVPTLSTFGHVTNVSEKADFLLVHFVYADKRQTVIYGDNVSSLPWILQENTGSMINACTDIQKTLQKYLGRFFDAVTVEVSFSEEDPDVSNSRVIISLNISIVENTVQYQVTRLIRAIDGKFKEFVNLNNEETT